MKVDVLNVRLSNEMVSWLDNLIEQGIYKSRSEALRDFIRNYLEKVS